MQNTILGDPSLPKISSGFGPFGGGICNTICTPPVGKVRLQPPLAFSGKSHLQCSTCLASAEGSEARCKRPAAEGCDQGVKGPSLPSTMLKSHFVLGVGHCWRCCSAVALRNQKSARSLSDRSFFVNVSAGCPFQTACCSRI